MTLAATTAAPHLDDTIVAVSSALGPGLRAIVRLSGPKTRDVVGKVFGPQEPDSRPPFPRGGGVLRRRVPGSLRLSGVHSPLPGELYFFAGPHSYTGQDLAELHIVGSPPLVEQLVADLLAVGTRPAQPGEFTLRAFLAGKKDLPQAEAVNAVIEAGTDSDLQAALAQLAGGVTQPLHTLREDLLNLLADLEAALDFTDEDIEFVSQADTLQRLTAGLAHLTNLQRQLDSRTISGRPVRVALVGRPNAGKSSLFNALSGGPAALVSAEAGTTRDYLTKRLDLGGTTAELVDTAGWAAAADTIEEQAQRLGSEQATQADIILWCDEHGEFDPANAARLRATGAEVLRVWTKRDHHDERRSGTLQVDTDHDSLVHTSAVTPDGTAGLRAALAERLVSLTRPPLAPSQSRCRHHVTACVGHLREAHRHVLLNDPAEIAALSLRAALDQLGEMAGSVYTNDLLDRIFSRFCIGK